MGKEIMKSPYLIIKVGCEGIEKLVWLTSDPLKAIGIRDRAAKWHIAEIDFRNRKTKNMRLATDKEITERYCIISWTGQKFECVCEELGIKHDEMVLY